MSRGKGKEPRERKTACECCRDAVISRFAGMCVYCQKFGAERESKALRSLARWARKQEPTSGTGDGWDNARAHFADEALRRARNPRGKP